MEKPPTELEIHFKDLTEEMQKQVLELHCHSNVKQTNWDVYPVFTLFVDPMMQLENIAAEYSYALLNARFFDGKGETWVAFSIDPPADFSLELEVELPFYGKLDGATFRFGWEDIVKFGNLGRLTITTERNES